MKVYLFVDVRLGLCVEEYKKLPTLAQLIKREGLSGSMYQTKKDVMWQIQNVYHDVMDPEKYWAGYILIEENRRWILNWVRNTKRIKQVTQIK